MAPTSLEELENEAYQDSFADGLIDLFVGLSLIAVGIDWLWIEPLPSLAGIIPALLALALVPIRRRILEPRLGYVAWRAPRLRRERRQLRLLLVLVIAAALAGNGAIVAIREGDLGDQGIVPGLPALILAIGALVVAATTGVKRLWGYGAVLIVAAVVIIAADEANPGGSLLVSGVIIAGTGALLLTRFLRTHPVRDIG